MFFKIGVLKIFSTKEVSVLESLFKKVTGPKVCNFRAKFLKNSFFKKHLRWLLLQFDKVAVQYWETASLLSLCGMVSTKEICRSAQSETQQQRLFVLISGF